LGLPHIIHFLAQIGNMGGGDDGKKIDREKGWTK
jgi:hypothetical protein